MELDNIVVDPRFWRRGLGTALCKHGMEIATRQGSSIGILAAGSGVALYEHLGFYELEKVIVRDDRKDENALVYFTVLKWPRDSKL